MSTVQAHSLEWDDPAGKLGKMTIDESIIPPDNRIPRATSATWYVVVTSPGFVAFLLIGPQEVHKWSCGELQPCRRTAGSQLQL
jgi:hypothetical protein